MIPKSGNRFSDKIMRKQNVREAKRFNLNGPCYKENEMAYAAKRNPDRCPTHPGALLREDIIPAVGNSVSEIADLLGISRQHLHAIMAEKKPVTPKVAVLLGKLFGDGTEIWVRMPGA